MNTRPLCLCCEETEATCSDPDLGPVCGECFALLHNIAVGLRQATFGFPRCGTKHQKPQ